MQANDVIAYMLVMLNLILLLFIVVIGTSTERICAALGMRKDDSETNSKPDTSIAVNPPSWPESADALRRRGDAVIDSVLKMSNKELAQ
jgi:hypothetical protein